jgi:hypothetical protein
LIVTKYTELIQKQFNLSLFVCCFVAAFDLFGRFFWLIVHSAHCLDLVVNVPAGLAVVVVAAVEQAFDAIFLLLTTHLPRQQEVGFDPHFALVDVGVAALSVAALSFEFALEAVPSSRIKNKYHIIKLCVCVLQMSNAVPHIPIGRLAVAAFVRDLLVEFAKLRPVAVLHPAAQRSVSVSGGCLWKLGNNQSP